MLDKKLDRHVNSGSAKSRRELRDKLVSIHHITPGSYLEYVKPTKHHICYHELVLFDRANREIGRLSSTNPMGNILNNFLMVEGECLS